MNLLSPQTRRRAVMLSLGCALLLSGEATGKVSREFKDRNCDDFDSQKQAQKFFEKKGGPKKDKHELDADNDGIACEDEFA